MQREHVLFLPATVLEGEGMVKSDLWHEIHSRFKLKETKKAIARTLGLSILTVRKVLRQAAPQPYRKAKTESELLAPHKGYILQRLAAVGYCARAVYEELQVRVEMVT
jgi:hypothetical protein